MSVPATGRPVRVEGAVVFRIADYCVAEEWHFDDMLGLLHPLGVQSPQPATR